MPQEFYQKEFVCGNSPITPGELEELPCPFCPAAVTDAQMQTVVKETDAETKLRWRLPTDGPIDFDNDRYNETWWDELEKAVLKHSVPYYEDIIEPTADNVAGWIRDVIDASEDTTVYLVSEENRSLKN